MRNRAIAVLMLLSLAAMPAWAQETRGNINGTVRDAQGVIPGATVRITNTDNNQTQQLVTNSSGYYEAPLLQAARYTVTVEMPGFKTATQGGITLSVGQTLSVNVTMEVGAVTEQVTVSAEAPLLDTSAVASGQNFDSKMIEGLPIASNQPFLLAKFAQGVTGPTTQQLVLQGQVDGPTGGAGSPTGGVGGFAYTLDGVTNQGNNGRMAASPNSDMIQEMRVETTAFDASMGHGAGATISMMTRAGTNLMRGTANYNYWTNQINSLNPQQKLAFSQRPETGELYTTGHSNSIAFTFGGPVVIPKLVNGRNKLFFFANYQQNADDSAARNTPTSTVPANEKHMNGDFSDLLTLATPSQYIIYDPLTTVPDPARPGSVIRTPFPGNIIPKDRFMNANGTYKSPLFALFRDMMPPPNQNFVEEGSIPTNNYYQGGTPNITDAKNFGIRVDYNASDTDRIFFRSAGTTFHERLGDWTYKSPNSKYHGLHVNNKTRLSWAYTGSYTKVMGSTVIDTQVSANRFFEDQQRRGMHEYKPTDVGLPSYLDEYCSTLDQCMLPRVQVAGYQGISSTANGGLDATHYQVLSNITQVRGAHTLRGGLDYRLHGYRNNLIAAGDVSSTYNFNQVYTRQNDFTTAASSDLGKSMAALMLGLPSTTTIGQDAPLDSSNPYVGLFFQDSWRATRNLTVNLGFRYQYEGGISEAQNRLITGFDPDAELSITELAQAAYAQFPIPQVPVSEFRVRGGSLYATAPGGSTTTHNGEAMWMPRVSLAYKLGDRTVLKGGYGLFYGTNNSTDYNGFNQLGYTSQTSNALSSDFGVTYNLGDPKNGVSPLADPFPVKATGSRYEPSFNDTLGVDTILGTNFTSQNQDLKHPRVQRWRVGVQREIFRTMAVEVSYTGAYTDRIGLNIAEVYVPEQYYSDVMGVRDTSAQTLLQQQVTNPFYIQNFNVLAVTDPTLYARMAGNTFFTAATVQRQALLRGYPHLSGLTFANQPLGISKTHSLELTLNRRFANGLSANMAFAANSVTENATTETYDREPNRWDPSNNGRPWRMSGGAVYELPFGNGKPFLEDGGAMSKIFGGWQTGGTFEWQPGAVLNWGNLFFYGDLDDIKKDNPEIALQRDGTIDASKTWFNTEAGFEKLSNAVPANFQKRQFPFRVDGVTGAGMFLVNMNVMRNFDLGSRRTFQFRLDVQNLFDSALWGNPEMNPTSTNFGKITTATNSLMRFFTFVARVSF